MRKNILFSLSILLCCTMPVGCSDDSSDTADEPTNPGTEKPGGEQTDPGQTVPGTGDEKNEPFCGDHECNNGETTETCLADCPHIVRCGDGICEKGETRLNCKADCPAICGDGICEPDGGETGETCPDECGDDEPVEPITECGDGICDAEDGETDASCPSDCLIEVSEKMSMDDFLAIDEPKYHIMYDYSRIQNPSSSSIPAALDDFFAYPYPDVMRADAEGHPEMTGWPFPGDLNALSKLAAIAAPFFNMSIDLNKTINDLLNVIQKERIGFSPLGGIYFRASSTLSMFDYSTSSSNGVRPPLPEDTVSAKSCYQLINVEPESSHYGERVPVYVTFRSAGDEKLWASNTLVMRPVPGLEPNPGDRHAAVVMDCLRSGAYRIAQSKRLGAILNKTAPNEISSRTDFYVDQLTKLGVNLYSIRALAAYQTSNVAVEMDQMAEALKGKGAIVTNEDGTAKGTWYRYPSASATTYSFNGQFVTYNFIEGDYSKDVPNYVSGGRIRFDSAEKLISKGQAETVNFSISIPNAPMPESGYPIIVYGHGTGGNAYTHVGGSNDEGTALLLNGVNAAMIGFDACLQGSRVSKSDSSSLMQAIANEPVIILESWRQTVNDMLVLYDILNRGELILPPNPEKPENSNKGNVIFDPSYGMYMGHSQGSQEGGLLLGLTGDIKNAFLSAGGGGISLSFIERKMIELESMSAPLNTFKDKSIAEILATVLALDPDSLSYDAFFTTQIVQPLTDIIDPLNFTQRFIKEPPNGWEPKNIAQTIGVGDQDTPNSIQLAMAVSEGLPVVGNRYLTCDAMRISGLDKTVNPPVSDNLSIHSSGKKSTGGVMHFDYTGTSNPHFVIYRMKAAKQSYIDFFKSILDGKPTITVDTKNQHGGNSV